MVLKTAMFARLVVTGLFHGVILVSVGDLGDA
jgi:hypothetical protein